MNIKIKDCMLILFVHRKALPFFSLASELNFYQNKIFISSLRIIVSAADPDNASSWCLDSCAPMPPDTFKETLNYRTHSKTLQFHSYLTKSVSHDPPGTERQYEACISNVVLSFTLIPSEANKAGYSLQH